MSTTHNKAKYNSFLMNLALLKAKKNLGCTGPNPSVGCVIVKNHSLITSTVTSFSGRPHAEANAINLAKKNIKNSEMFVTLEPCSNYGKTSPCVNKIIKAKISKVFFGINDPDKRSYRKCYSKLKRNNIFVNKGILKNKVVSFYKSYINYKKKGMPYIITKIAVSKDLYLKNKNKRWVTNYYSRARGHLLRSQNDAIVTTSRTIIDDNPLLDCRINGLEKFSPVKIIIDKNLKIPISSKVVKYAKKHKTIIFYNKKNKKKINILSKFKIKCFFIELNKERNLDLSLILKKISNFGYARILVEAGLEMNNSLLKDKLINEIYLFKSNKKISSSGQKSIKKILLNNKISKKKFIETS